MKYSLEIDTNTKVPPTRDLPAGKELPSKLPDAKEVKVHPTNSGKGSENASLLFVGTATCLLEWEGIRVMTDPNFLHAGDHVHLGPGVIGTRQTNPAVDLHDLPNVDLVLLSHYHADHFDQKVEESLRRDLPIITTPHAKDHLSNKGDDSFTKVFDLDFFQDMLVKIGTGSSTSAQRQPQIKVVGTPGKHVGDGVISTLNDYVKAVPPTNGWLVELGYGDPSSDSTFECGYRIYISGDTLMVSELTKIPEYVRSHSSSSSPTIDLMLIHLGGTTIPSPSMPLLMVTMDAKQGVELVKLIGADVNIPIHYDDYDVFLSPLSDFKEEMKKAGLEDKVVYLDRGDRYDFGVGKEQK